MRIRAARSVDSRDISELISALSVKFITEEFSPSGREHLLSTMTPQAIKKYIQSGYRYHVAEENDKLVGVVAVRDNRHLYHLFVAEQHQRQGIARKLWGCALENCLDKGNTGEFTVNSSAYARHVYEQLGFVAQPGPKVHKGVVFFPMKLTFNSRH